MGQGTESCGGYDVNYDPYWDEMHSGKGEPLWTCKDGSQIPISKMSDRHLRGAIRVASQAAKRANFSCDADNFHEWVDMMEDELYSRIGRTSNMPAKKESNPAPKVKSISQPKKPTRGSKVEVKCKWCKKKFMARVADRKRGWAKFCSKSCKASKQTYDQHN